MIIKKIYSQYSFVNCSNAYLNYLSDCKALICDFHREQAWGRWLRATKHGLSRQQDEILAILRRIARALSKVVFDKALANLKDNRLWREHKDFRDWFTNTWLKSVQVCDNTGVLFHQGEELRLYWGLCI